MNNKEIFNKNQINTNFNVGFTKEEVLNRPAIIKTKNNYYYAGEKIKIEDIPTNGVIIQANTEISVWLLYTENNQVCLSSGYIRSWDSPVAKSKNKTTLKDWLIEYINQTFVGVDCTKSNPQNKLNAIRYGIDLRRSVFMKTRGWYNHLPKHLTEQPLCQSLAHPQTLELIIKNGGNSEDISAACARTPYDYGATVSQFAQMNYNYIRNWARREDVLHYASLLSTPRWANTLGQMVSGDKFTVQEYLIILHDFYSDIDTVLRKQSMLAQEKELNNKFEIAAKEFAKYSYEDDELMICPPHNLDELHNEGNTLHHCVFGFRQKMANKQSIIFFIRRKAAEGSPYYTVELVNDSTKWIRQVHGMRNSQPTPQIVNFLRKWVANFNFNPDVKEIYNALG